MIDIKSTTPFLEKAKGIIDSFTDVSWICELEPVMPVLGGRKRELPFYSDKEMLEFAELNDLDLADLALKYETARAGLDPAKLVSMMREIVLHVKNSVKEGLSGPFITTVFLVIRVI